MTTTDTPEPKPRKPYAMTAAAIRQRREAGRKSKGRSNPGASRAMRQRWAIISALLAAHQLSAGSTGTIDTPKKEPSRSLPGDNENSGSSPAGHEHDGN